MKNVSKKYKGWDVKVLNNKLIKLIITPQLGGRIIQFEMNDYEFLFNNPLLKGIEPDETRLGKNGTWLNFGGEKIWPAPQGWNSTDQWSGPPDPVLDSGIYSVDNDSTYNKQNGFGLKLTSPVDHRTGLQIKKEIFIPENSSKTEVNVTFYNQEKDLGRWSIWPVLQMNTPAEDIDRYRVICPVNPESKFKNGYKIIHGLVNNPQYWKDASGKFVVNYRYLVGKVGLDSNAGWIAFLDSITGKIFVLIFDYHEDANYPEDTSVQVWTQGRGIIYSRGKIIEFQNNKKLNPPYMEMELLSPLKEIQKGKSIDFKFRIFCSTIANDEESIIDVNEFGIVVRRISFKTEGDNIFIEAKYGVFTEGKLEIILTSISGAVNKKVKVIYEKEVNPFEGIIIRSNIKKCWVLDKKLYLLSAIFDTTGNFLGEIDRIKLK